MKVRLTRVTPGTPKLVGFQWNRTYTWDATSGWYLSIGFGLLILEVRKVG